jgi:hypothetical protein
MGKCSLGMMLERGLRGKTDPVAALRWYQRAAVQGHAEAAFRLGSLIELGDGVAKNLPEAAAWPQLALHYAIGAGGGERDPQKALMALEIGAALGQGDNAAFRETLIAKLSPGQIAAAKGQAMARLQKRAP